MQSKTPYNYQTSQPADQPTNQPTNHNELRHGPRDHPHVQLAYGYISVLPQTRNGINIPEDADRKSENPSHQCNEEKGTQRPHSSTYTHILNTIRSSRT